MNNASLLAQAPLSSGFQLPADFSFEQDVVVLAGTGAGPFLAELARLGIHRVVVFAPSGESFSPDVRLASQPQDVVARILDFEPRVRRITLQRLPAGGLDAAQLEELKKQLEIGGMNRATLASTGAIWVRQALQNLPALGSSPSIDCLKDSFAGKPCVLVSPGPSLQKNIDVLRELAPRVLIIAGNRALAPLRRAGITPDIVVVADAMDLSYHLGGGLLDGVPALVLDMVVSPAVCRIPAARRFFFSVISEIRESTLAGLGQQGALSGGGSVATVALSLALHLGAGAIFLVGQDLALNGDQYYVPTAPDGAMRIELQGRIGTFQNSSTELRQAMHDVGGTKLGEAPVQDFLQVPGYDGGLVYTSVHFDTYRRWFSNAAREQAGRVRIVNCTEGGARIEHMQQARLVDVARELEADAFDAASVLRACHEREPRKARLQALERHVKQLQRTLGEAFEEVQRCERISHQVERAPDQLERLDRAEAKLNQAVSQLPFIAALASDEVERARRAGANAKNLQEALAATRRLYAVIKQAVTISRPALAAALSELKRSA